MADHISMAKVELPFRQAILNRRTFEPAAEGRGKKARLDFNENTAGCSRAAVAALRKLTTKELATYPEYQRTTRTLARYFGVKTEEILLANGGDDTLRIFFDGFVDADSAVLICEPTFPMYRYYAEIYGAHVDALRYGPEMEFPLEEIVLALSNKPRVLFIANPNNPTGTLAPLRDLASILEAAPDTVVVIDEAYAEYSGVTVVPWIRKHPQLFVVRTFSKAAGLAALRLGAVIGPSDSIAILRRTLPPFPVNLAALVTAEAAARDKATMRRHVEETLQVRAWFAQQLQKLGMKSYPSAGNFLLVDFGGNGPDIFRRFERDGILVRERPDLGAGFARITMGTRKEMEQVVKKINARP
jgi:histidinol-phosphate aminotransferase